MDACGAGITLWRDSIRKRPGLRSLAGAQIVGPVRHAAARISAQRPRYFGLVLDAVAGAQPGAGGEPLAQRGRRIGAAEPLAVVEHRALPGVGRRHDDLTAGARQAVDDRE